jgi:glycosyltransferase involved in cell wall biosynthesis
VASGSVTQAPLRGVGHYLPLGQQPVEASAVTAITYGRGVAGGIVVNGASFPQRVTGVQRYAREVAVRLLIEPDVRLAVPSPPEGLAVPVAGQMHVLRSPGATARLGAWGWTNIALRRHLSADDVLWSPTVRAPFGVPRQVPTIHDLSVFDHPGWFRPSVRAQHRLLVPRLVRAAPAVITDSRFSRDRLVDRLRVDPAKVFVVPCGVNPAFGASTADDVRAARAALDLPERFVLSVASVDPRKNVAVLVEAWRALPDALRRELPLLLAGGGARTFAASGAVKELPPGVRSLGYVPDEQLPAVYAASTVFAYPSRYEGFGMPPLEAMAAGTPVVALASTPAVVEVAEGAALLVPGEQAGSLTDALRALAGDDALRDRLVSAGRQRAAAYTWEATAAGVLSVLRSVRGHL